MKYRKKPIVIEATRLHKSNHMDIMEWADRYDVAIEKKGDCLLIETLEGKMRANIGDYIIKGVRDEFYPCKPDVFKKTYDAVGEENKRTTVAVDFDGVIHKYSKGWHDGTCYDNPMPGAEHGLKELMKTQNVFILSTRDPGQIKEWMDNNINIPTTIIAPGTLFWNHANVIGITNNKLAAIAYIDDRAVKFTGWLKNKKKKGKK